MNHNFNFEVVQLDEVSAAVPPESLADDTGMPIVLIVDDEPLIVDSLAAILSRNGFVTLSAYSGPRALELARCTPPDLLITDVAMPLMNGIELAMQVVAELPTCKVLLFSAHASSLDLTPARRAGHDFPLLAKPVPPRQMLARVMECFQVEPAFAN